MAELRGDPLEGARPIVPAAHRLRDRHVSRVPEETKKKGGLGLGGMLLLGGIGFVVVRMLRGRGAQHAPAM